jgi:hypothetical protein
VGKKGRPRLGGEARTERILVCLEPSLRGEIESLAEESRRSLSDYCRYVLEQHVLVVKEEAGLVEEVPIEAAPAEKHSEEPAKEPTEDSLPTCGACKESFANCNC